MPIYVIGVGIIIINDDRTSPMICVSETETSDYTHAYNCINMFTRVMYTLYWLVLYIVMQNKRLVHNNKCC